MLFFSNICYLRQGIFFREPNATDLKLSLLVAWLPYESLSFLKVAVSPEPSETFLRVRGPNCLSQGVPTPRP